MSLARFLTTSSRQVPIVSLILGLTATLQVLDGASKEGSVEDSALSQAMRRFGSPQVDDVKYSFFGGIWLEDFDNSAVAFGAFCGACAKFHVHLRWVCEFC